MSSYELVANSSRAKLFRGPASLLLGLLSLPSLHAARTFAGAVWRGVKGILQYPRARQRCRDSNARLYRVGSARLH